MSIMICDKCKESRDTDYVEGDWTDDGFTCEYCLSDPVAIDPLCGCSVAQVQAFGNQVKTSDMLPAMIGDVLRGQYQ